MKKCKNIALQDSFNNGLKIKNVSLTQDLMNKISLKIKKSKSKNPLF